MATQLRLVNGLYEEVEVVEEEYVTPPDPAEAVRGQIVVCQTELVRLNRHLAQLEGREYIEDDNDIDAKIQAVIDENTALRKELDAIKTTAVVTKSESATVTVEHTPTVGKKERKPYTKRQSKKMAVKKATK